MDQPDGGSPPRRRRSRYWWLVGLAIAALIVIVLAPLASSDPDGLQRVAGDNGFLQAARNALFSIIPHYNLPGVQGSLSTILAGLIGIVIVFALMVVVGRILVRRRR
jgi:PDGLE domain